MHHALQVLWQLPTHCLEHLQGHLYVQMTGTLTAQLLIFWRQHIQQHNAMELKHKQLHDALLLISLDHFGTQQAITVSCMRDILQIRTKWWHTSWMLTLS